MHTIHGHTRAHTLTFTHTYGERDNLWDWAKATGIPARPINWGICHHTSSCYQGDNRQDLHKIMITAGHYKEYQLKNYLHRWSWHQQMMYPFYLHNRGIRGVKNKNYNGTWAHVLPIIPWSFQTRLMHNTGSESNSCQSKADAATTSTLTGITKGSHHTTISVKVTLPIVSLIPRLY